MALALASAAGPAQAATQAMRASAGARDAASPDGWQTSGRTPVTAYVVNFPSGTVTPIKIATNRAGRPIPVGSSPDAIAITPDGKTAYVVDEGSGTITPISTATSRAGKLIRIGALAGPIAITAGGQTSYVIDGPDEVTPIRTATNTAGSPIPAGSLPGAIAITP